MYIAEFRVYIVYSVKSVLYQLYVTKLYRLKEHQVYNQLVIGIALHSQGVVTFSV